MTFDEWCAEGERLGLEDWENWSRHYIRVESATQPDPRSRFPCDSCGAKPQEKCTDDCKYQKLKGQLGI